MQFRPLAAALLMPFVLTAAVRAQTTTGDGSGSTDPLAAGIALQTAKQYDDAIAFFDKIAASNASDTVRARALARKGFAYVFKGDRVNARKAYLDLVARFPKESEHACAALKNTGELYAQDKDYPNAIATFQRAIDNYGKVPEARKWVAQAQHRIGMTYLAYHDPKANGTRDIKKAAEAFQHVVSDYPDQTDSVTDAKMQLVALKLEFAINGWTTYAEAQADCDTFLKAYPDDAARLPTVHIVRAEALYYQDRYDEAITEIGIIQSKYPGAGQASGTAQFLLGRSYMGKLDYARAIVEFQKFLDTVTISFSAWEERPGAEYFIGQSLKAMGQTADSLAEFVKLKQDYPQSYFVNLANTAGKAAAR